MYVGMLIKFLFDDFMLADYDERNSLRDCESSYTSMNKMVMGLLGMCKVEVVHHFSISF